MFCSNNGGPPILSSFEQPSSVRFFNLTVWPKWPMMLQIKHFKYNFYQKRSKEFLMECCFTLLILMKALIFWVDPVNNAFANPKIISVWNPQLLPVTTLKRINQLPVIMIQQLLKHIYKKASFSYFFSGMAVSQWTGRRGRMPQSSQWNSLLQGRFRWAYKKAKKQEKSKLSKTERDYFSRQ